MEDLQRQLRVAQTAVAALQSELASKLGPLSESPDSLELQSQVRQLQEELQLAKSSYHSSTKEVSINNITLHCRQMRYGLSLPVLKCSTPEHAVGFMYGFLNLVVSGANPDL